MSRVRRLVLGALIGLVACGDEPRASLDASVRVEGLVAADVSAMTLYVLGPRRRDDIILTCSNLLDAVVRPGDSKVVRLAHRVVDFTDSTQRKFTLGGIEAQDDVIVFVEATGVGNLVVGRGCEDGIKVSSDATTKVVVTVLP